MFFFFFDQLYEFPQIHEAFRIVCLEKMLVDGYFDMNIYFFGRLKKKLY